MPPPPVTTTSRLESSQSTSTLHPSRTPTFDEHNENLHRIEFEAPLSAGGQPLTQGRFSIDFSLELERQLAMESPPVTPAYDAITHAQADSKAAANGNVSQKTAKDFLPDPDVLAHIVTQLRQSLTDMTRERDELVKMLAEANSQEAYAKDALQVMTDKATDAEDELCAARKKMREDEDQIVLLRAKVEESRRGLMRLQTESRRQSIAPIDVSRASTLSIAAFGSPPSNKRASFTPLTGTKNGHRRISSVSDSNTFGAFPTPDLTPSPNAQAFHIASAEAALSGAPSSSRRFSGLFGRQSPPENDGLHPAEAQAINAAELDAVRAELKTIKVELHTVKHDLIEANEAKEASETCVQALREFIAENNIGVTTVKLPPPPTMTTGDDNFADPKKTSTGWGFKLWGGAASVDSPLGSSMPSATPYSASAPGVLPTQMAAPPQQPAVGAVPLTRKLGGLFSSRSSISSTTSREQPAPLQMNTALPHLSHRDSVYSYSDASSIAEPVSPGSDVHGLGTAGFGPAFGPGQMKMHAEVDEEEVLVVRDVTNLSRVHHAGDVEKSAGTPASFSEVDLNGLR